MSEVRIQFINVGRNKFSDTLTFRATKKNYAFSPDDIAALAFKEAGKHLISANVETVYDSEKNEGTIFAGFHTVGKFKVVKEEGKNERSCENSNHG